MLISNTIPTAPRENLFYTKKKKEEKRRRLVERKKGELRLDVVISCSDYGKKKKKHVVYLQVQLTSS